MGAQNTNCTMKFIDIPEDRQREAINTVALQTGLPPSSIEKDWWVTGVESSSYFAICRTYCFQRRYKSQQMLELDCQILRRRGYCTQPRIPWL